MHFFLIFFVFVGKISLCRLGWPGAHYVDQATIQFIEIHLPLPLERWD